MQVADLTTTQKMKEADWTFNTGFRFVTSLNGTRPVTDPRKRD